MKETTITAILIGIVIFLVIATVFLVPVISKKSNKLFEYTPTEKVFRIWWETSLTTDIHSQAFKELKKRGYWEAEHKKAEIESIEVYNKYK